ncbi:ATP-binding protein [Streptomyces sp. 4N509B]|uniref:ATP-binding protein n=1 Tax=Streptomyces sp. 4N509B TaxID=3457413 RepID=UPI003FD22AC4
MDRHHPVPRDEQAASAELVVGDFLVTVDPAEGCTIEPCPPGRRPPPRPTRRAAEGEGGGVERRIGRPDMGGSLLLERHEDRQRLRRLLSRGRSVRLLGPPGVGRSALLSAVAQDAAGLAPDGVIRLSGHRRTPDDLLHELYRVARPDAGGHRPGREELAAALREIGAVVVVDDLEFGGSALDDVLDATPECAFLLSPSPEVPGPAVTSRVEEVALAGLSRTACLEILEITAGRPPSDAEADWAADLWLATEGLPLCFTQAGALLRHGGQAPPGGGQRGGGLTAELLRRLPEEAREALRFALALGGELPDAAHLVELTGHPGAVHGHAELVGSGLVTAVGSRHRVAPATSAALAGAGLADGATGRALTAARHFARWAGSSATAAWRVEAEAEVLLAALQAVRRADHAAAAVALARAAAPRLVTGARWSAWERMVRGGGEAARAAGDLAAQAYFHHELGVLSICQGRLDRALAELEASTTLRSVISDAAGATAGRRALALARDLNAPRALPPSERSARLSLPPGAAAPSPAPPVGPTPAVGPEGAAHREEPTTGLPALPPAASSAVARSAADDDPTRALPHAVPPALAGPELVPVPVPVGSEDLTQAIEPVDAVGTAYLDAVDGRDDVDGRDGTDGEYGGVGEDDAASSVGTVDLAPGWRANSAPSPRHARPRRRGGYVAAGGAALVAAVGAVVAFALTSHDEDTPVSDDQPLPAATEPDFVVDPEATTPAEPTGPTSRPTDETSPSPTSPSLSETSEATTPYPDTPTSPDPGESDAPTETATGEVTTSPARPTRPEEPDPSPTDEEPDPSPTDEEPDPSPTDEEPDPSPTETEPEPSRPDGSSTMTEPAPSESPSAEVTP